MYAVERALCAGSERRGHDANGNGDNVYRSVGCAERAGNVMTTSGLTRAGRLARATGDIHRVVRNRIPREEIRYRDDLAGVVHSRDGTQPGPIHSYTARPGPR